MEANETIIREFAVKAYEDLGSSVPEFGEETRSAIFDTAADALYDAGYRGYHDGLRAICEVLA